MHYNYFIPLINLGPFKGYTFMQELPLNDIARLIVGTYAKFEIIRKVYVNKKKINEYKGKIEFKFNNWTHKRDARFSYVYSGINTDIGFIETEVNLILGKGLRSSSIPSFYVKQVI